MKINTKSLLYGTFILACANFFVRLLGFVYRIILSRTIGAEGIGLMQLIHPLLMVMFTLTASGFGVAVSRLVAQQKAIGDDKGVKRIVKTALLISFCLSAACCLFLFINVDMITNDFLRDARVRKALFFFIPSIPILSAGAILNSCFYGLKNIHPPALSEIIEQVTKMGLILTIVYMIPGLNEESFVVVSVIGLVFGELCNFLCLYYNYRHSVSPCNNANRTPNYFMVIKSILTISVPITAARLIGSFISAANSVLIPQRLIASGLSNSDALRLFGMVTGMVLPLLFIPFTLTNSLSTLIIPNISGDLALKNWRSIRNKVTKTIFITCLTAFPSMAFLIPLAYPIGYTLYAEPVIGRLLMPLAFSLIFFCLQQSLGSILHGLGRQNLSSIYSVIGGLIQITCTYYLASLPNIRVYGFIIGFIVSSMTVSTLSLITIINIVKIRLQLVEWFVKPAAASWMMGLAVHFCYTISLSSGLSSGLSLILCIPLGIVTLIVGLLLIGSISITSLKRISSYIHLPK